MAVEEFSMRGGARIGWVNASWPFATLTISRGRLTLSSLGRYEFDPTQVISIERYGSIPFLASGLRINHNRADYPEKMIFWCMGSRDKLLAQITRSGFSPKAHGNMRPRGFPIRWSVIVAFLLIWNALFLLDGPFSFSEPKEPGPFVLIALILVFAFSTAVKRSAILQQIVLRKDHHVGEVKAFLVLLQLVSGLLLLIFGVTLLARTYAG